MKTTKFNRLYLQTFAVPWKELETHTHTHTTREDFCHSFANCMIIWHSLHASEEQRFLAAILGL